MYQTPMVDIPCEYHLQDMQFPSRVRLFWWSIVSKGLVKKKTPGAGQTSIVRPSSVRCQRFLHKFLADKNISKDVSRQQSAVLF